MRWEPEGELERGIEPRDVERTAVLEAGTCTGVDTEFRVEVASSVCLALSIAWTQLWRS